MRAKNLVAILTKSKLAVAIAVLGFSIIGLASAFSLPSRKSTSIKPLNNQKPAFNVEEAVNPSPCLGENFGNKPFFLSKQQIKAGETLIGCINTKFLGTQIKYVFPKNGPAYSIQVFSDFDSSIYSSTELVSGITAKLPKPLVQADGTLSFLKQESESNGYLAVSIETLNYKAGKYGFFVSYAGPDYYFGSVTITESAPAQVVVDKIRTDMRAGNIHRFALYSDKGERLGQSYTFSDNHFATLRPNTDYFVAVDLAMVKGFEQANGNVSFDNTITVDFYDGKYTWDQIGKTATGVDNYSPSVSDFLKIQIDSTTALPLVAHANRRSFVGDPACGASSFDLSNYPDGIAIIPFTTPVHHPYYEVDGKLRFKFFASGEQTSGCTLREYSFLAGYDDSSSIKKPISINVGAPLESFSIRLVRVGNIGLNDKAKLQAFADELESVFSKVTKNYFKIDVLVGDVITYGPKGNTPEFQPAITQLLTSVKSWYAQTPKVSGKSILNLNQTDDLYIATYLYFGANPVQLAGFIKKLYPPQKNGEYLTLYIVDENIDGYLGKVLFETAGVMVKGVYMFPTEGVFQKTAANGTASYMVDFSDKSIPYICGNSVKDYLYNCLAKQSENGLLDTNQTISTAVHEIAHTLWEKKNLMLAGKHPELPPKPFLSKPVFADGFMPYVTRGEIMSTGRNRNVLEGMVLGDVFLEDILKFYGVVVP